MILSFSIIAKWSISCVNFLVNIIFPVGVYEPVLTSIRFNSLFFRIAKSQEQLGLNALKTSYPLISKSMLTFSSPIVPMVPVARLYLSFIERYFILVSSPLHKELQNFAFRLTLFSGNFLLQVRHLIFNCPPLLHNTAIFNICQAERGIIYV